jgi:serine/threonine protein kinase
MEEFNKIKPKKIDLADYTFETTLGSGSFGRVKLSKNKRTGQYAAIKILKKFEIIKLKQVDHILNEVKILSMIDHPFLVKIEGFSQDDKFLYLILELVNGGELFTYLRNVGKFSAPQACFYAAQVVVMFEYLHSKNIIYRDLKPENVLIDKDGYLKLTDFGFAKICEGRTYTLCGTPEYLAPEILLNKGHGKPVDWWTFGVLLYEMIAGIDPFNDDDPMLVYQKILKGKIKFPSSFDSNAKSLVKHILVIDLSKRYGNLKNGVDDIKNHRFFKNMNWNDLVNKKLPVMYKPKVNAMNDVSNFNNIDDDDEDGMNSLPIKKEEDPFLSW